MAQKSKKEQIKEDVAYFCLGGCGTRVSGRGTICGMQRCSQKVAARLQTMQSQAA